ncbi:MAG TPA: LPS export ABC transporter periplasmic protein LptC [Pusillimonas sp.]|uniref:LPS export ABC transporter periplasmic protein LptC n=1 Tax=unclassified Pusillimonas TaxID=2640016 RepID=UPI002621D5F3|nr:MULTISPECIES: LPS export ABC transporter periplasmic protein LptC [unclassified Pusillimonas]HLU18842.1 LPS export ABC transporter periplasmic protein LptC [Pusillimonas sp.]
MKERVPALVAIALLIFLVIGTWWAADYTQRAVSIEPPRRITHEPDAWSRNFVMVRTDAQGVAINRIEGDYLQHFPDDDSYEVQQARATGQRADSPVTVGTSNIAIMDRDGTRIIMRGDAHLHRQPYDDRPALDVSSEELILLPDEDVAYTDLPAVVVNGKSTMVGTGMRYDNGKRTLQVFSSSDVRIAAEDAQATRSENQGSRDKNDETKTP